MDLLDTPSTCFRGGVRYALFLLTFGALALGTPAALHAQDGGGIRVEPYVGLAYTNFHDIDTDNTWGGTIGVRIGVPVANRLHLTGTANYTRTNSARREVYYNGGFVSAYEMVALTGGVGYDVVAGRKTRVVLGVEAGIGGERMPETERFGTPRPGQFGGSESFSFNPAGLLRLGVERALTSRFAVTASLRSYIGTNGMLPSLSFGVSRSF